MRILLLKLLLACAPLAAETGYRYVHPDGTVEFSDQPIPGAEEIKLREAPTIEFVPVSPSPPGSNGGATATEEAQRAIRIVSPQRDQTLWYDEKGLMVSVAVQPPLKEGEKIRITLDGREVASGRGNSFHIGIVHRGSHTLGAAVIGKGGAVVSSSTPITFYMRQHSLLERKPIPEDGEEGGVEPILPE